jgi:hypothetical protein
MSANPKTSLIVEQAKQGDPKAIAQLINKALVQREQTATVIGDAANLRILVEGLSTPDEVTTFSLIEKGLKSLDLAQAMQVQLYGQHSGAAFPDWMREFSTGKQADLPNIFSFDTVTVELPPKSEIGQTATPSQFSDLDSSGSATDRPTGQSTEQSNSQPTGQSASGSVNQPTQPSKISRAAFRSNSDRPDCPKTYLVPSILIFILTVFPLSVVSLIFAAQVNSNYQRGNYTAAEKASKRAKLWCIINVCVAAPIYLLVGAGIVAAIVDGAESASSSTDKKSIQQIKTLVRYQEAYFLENDRFTSDLAEFPALSSDAYRYTATTQNSRLVKITAIPKVNGRKSFTAAVLVPADQGDRSFESASIICRSQRTTKVPPATPQVTDTGLACATGSTEVTE